MVSSGEADASEVRVERVHRDSLAKEVCEELSDGEKEEHPVVAEAVSKKRQVVESSMPAPPSIFQACLIVRRWSGGQASSDIPHRQQEYLIKARFTVPEIAKLVVVSLSTIRCRMLEYSLTIQGTYSDTSDAELDAEDAKVQKEFPGWGNHQLHGCLQSCVRYSSSGSVCSQLPTLSGSRRANHASIVPFAEEKVGTYV